MNAPPQQPLAYPFAGGGRIGATMAGLDWSATALGAPATWPETLRAAVALMLPIQAEAVLFWGEDHLALYNDAYAALMGPGNAAALGQPAAEHWADIWSDVRPQLDHVRASGEAIDARDRPVRRPRGELARIDISYSPIREPDGRIGGVLCVLAPASRPAAPGDRYLADIARLSRLVEQAPGFVAVLAQPGHVFRLTNRAYRQLVGHRNLIGLPLAQALPELAAQGFIETLDEVVTSGRAASGRAVPVTIQRRPDGATEKRLLNFVYQPITDGADERVIAVFVQGYDVTKQVEAEERLALSESTLRLATETAEIGTWDVDLVTDTLVWPERTRAMFGIFSDRPVSMDDFYAGLHPDDLPATEAAFASAVDPARRATYDVEYRTIGREDGIVRWVAAKGRGLFDEAGTCIRAIGTAIDITRRRAADDAIRESEERFRTIAETAPALIWVSDADGRTIFANHWFNDLFGRVPDHMLGEDWRRFLHPDDADRFFVEFGAAVAARVAWSGDVRVIDRTGVVRWLHTERRPRYSGEAFAGYVGCSVDITEARLAARRLERAVADRTGELAAANAALADANEALTAQIAERERIAETLSQMQRLEAVGQLTSGVAHDFNNLLTVVLGNVEMIERAAAGGTLDERARARLGHVRAAAERGASLTTQLLAFARRQRLEARAIDLNRTVSGIQELLRTSLGGAVAIETRLEEAPWAAMVDPTQIELIILNLAINARDAMPGGGTLRIATANVTLGEPGRPEEPAAGDYVRVAVADTGSGMSPQVLARAFEPFFTTKPVGKGSGLGLAQAFGFAKQSGGGMRIDTVEGMGTTVSVYLPRAEAAVAPGEEAPAPAAPPARRSGRVLVVDDDAAVRAITAEALAGLGCEVAEADGGPMALALLEREGGRFDLIVADFAMPEMNGAELARLARERWPALPLLFVTGYADLAEMTSVDEELIVQKPFRGDELTAKARRLLDGGR